MCVQRSWQDIQQIFILIHILGNIKNISVKNLNFECSKVPITGKILDRDYGVPKEIDEECKNLVYQLSFQIILMTWINLSRLTDSWWSPWKSLPCLKLPVKKLVGSANVLLWLMGKIMILSLYAKTIVLYRTDDRVNFPTKHGELSLYMSQYWKTNTDAPASSMNVRRKHFPCHRSRLEWFYLS